MKRVTFLKSVITLITALTLMGEVEVKPFSEVIPEVNNISGNIRIYVNYLDGIRLRDVIKSDIGDCALVMCLSNVGKPFIECRPYIQGRYRYVDLSKFQLLARAYNEA